MSDSQKKEIRHLLEKISQLISHNPERFARLLTQKLQEPAKSSAKKTVALASDLGARAQKTKKSKTGP